MKPVQLTTPQRWLLNQIATGGKLYHEGEGLWYLQDKDGLTPHLPTGTARALATRNLIEPTGSLYWRMTDAGRAALAGQGRLL